MQLAEIAVRRGRRPVGISPGGEGGRNCNLWVLRNPQRAWKRQEKALGRQETWARGHQPWEGRGEKQRSHTAGLAKAGEVFIHGQGGAGRGLATATFESCGVTNFKTPMWDHMRSPTWGTVMPLPLRTAGGGCTAHAQRALRPDRPMPGPKHPGGASRQSLSPARRQQQRPQLMQMRMAQMKMVTALGPMRAAVVLALVRMTPLVLIRVLVLMRVVVLARIGASAPRG